MSSIRLRAAMLFFGVICGCSLEAADLPAPPAQGSAGASWLEAKDGWLSVASDVPIFVLPGHQLHPRFKSLKAVLSARKISGPVRIEISEARPLSGFAPATPLRSVKVRIVLGPREVILNGFPLRLGIARDESYQPGTAEDEFFYPLYVAVEMLAKNPDLFEDAAASAMLVERLAIGVASLRADMKNFPLALRELLPSFLGDLSRLVALARDEEADCEEASARAASSLARRALFTEILRNRFVDITTQVAKWF